MKWCDRLQDELKRLVPDVNNLTVTELQTCLQFVNDILLAKQKHKGDVCHVLIALMVEAGREDISVEEVREFVTTQGIKESHCEMICNHYHSHGKEYREVLSRVGWRPPVVRDCSCKLTHVVTASNPSQIGRPVFAVDLWTQVSGKSKPEIMQLHCSPHELQDVVSSLKEASQALQRIAKS